jgi:methionyl-tRNA synthetase
MRPFYVTTPIYYVNDLPHIGHIYTTVVADAVARYRRLAGDEVFFLTGTDEHGQNIERAAEREGIQPIELADRVVERYHELWRQFAMSHDDFVRTTEPRHVAGVREIIRRIEAVGDLYVDRHEGWYCPSCETFYTEKELGEAKLCPVHERPAEWHSEENIFFRLAAYQERLLDLYASQPGFVRPETRLNEVRSFVESGLRDLSVSRADLAWGIPFPGHPGQTVYVWLDALTNYVSALGFGSPDGTAYRRFWESDGTRLHLVGKDILRFHAVYWPAFLMSAGLPLPTTVWAHGWWLRDQKKISKSVGNLVRPDELVERFGPDALRYFLLREMIFGQDAQFSDEAFVDRYNGDLANDLGNTASRVVTLSRRAFDGATPPEACDDNPLIAVAERAIAGYHEAMRELAFSRALESLWRLLAEANQYLVEREPWKMIKAEGATPALSRVLWNGLEAVRLVATALLPVMPQTAPRVLAAVGTAVPPEGFDGPGGLAWGGTPTGALLPEPEPLFPRIDKEAYLAGARPGAAGTAPAPPAATAAAAEASEPGPEASPEAGPAPGPVNAPGGSEAGMIDIERFFETELKVATVTAAEPVPKSNKLLKLSLDLGGESRQVVAGIAKAYAPEALVGRQVVVVANLQPATLMGVESQGMVLAASVDGEPVLLHPEREVPPGTRVR